MQTDTAFVKTSLQELINKHLEDVDISCIDDIVLSYVSGVVEEITADEEELDSAAMKDVMSAYIPHFEAIPECVVEAWVHELVQNLLGGRHTAKGKSIKDATFDAVVSSISVKTRKLSSNSEGSDRSSKLSETSDSSDDSTIVLKEENDQYGDALALLVEMFPGSCSLEAQHCLSNCGGSLESATSLLLEREEQGISLKSPVASFVPKSARVADDETIRNSILTKYGFIDKDDDRKEHRPVAPKWEGKKMIRYRDNKIVSMKGERFTEVKKGEAEEMKKTYVNLKPAKQYRFH